VFVLFLIVMMTWMSFRKLGGGCFWGMGSVRERAKRLYGTRKMEEIALIHNSKGKLLAAAEAFPDTVPLGAFCFNRVDKRRQLKTSSCAGLVSLAKLKSFHDCGHVALRY
jgi:hypothetical protein